MTGKVVHLHHRVDVYLIACWTLESIFVERGMETLIDGFMSDTLSCSDCGARKCQSEVEGWRREYQIFLNRDSLRSLNINSDAIINIINWVSQRQTFCLLLDSAERRGESAESTREQMTTLLWLPKQPFAHHQYDLIYDQISNKREARRKSSGWKGLTWLYPEKKDSKRCYRIILIASLALRMCLHSRYH